MGRFFAPLRQIIEQPVIRPSARSRGDDEMTNRKIGVRAATSRRPLTRRSTLKGGLALGAGLAVGTFAIIGKASAAPIDMRFGSDSSIRATHTVSALVMKDLIEKGTAGRVQVTIFPDGQLGGNMVMTNSIKSGTLDAVVTAVALIAPAVPEVDVFSLPFVFKDAMEALRIANGPFGAKLTPQINAAFECQVLAYTTDGASQLYTKKHPVRTPEDMVGLKVAVSTSQIQRDTFLAFGAIPTVLDVVAIYTALQTGLIDCTRSTPLGAIDLKIYQVTKYLTLANLYSVPNPLLVSNKFLEKLSPGDRDVVVAAGLPACNAQVDATNEGEKTAIPFLREHGIETVEIESLQAFRDKVEIVYKKAGDRIGPDIIAEVRKLASG
jgi:TRAP-type transport system periplasmic protein